MLVLGYEIEYVIRCLSTHFLFASVSGLLAFFLTWTICSRATPERATYLSPFFAGLFCAVLSHWIIDTYTNLA